MNAATYRITRITRRQPSVLDRVQAVVEMSVHVGLLISIAITLWIVESVLETLIELSFHAGIA